MVRGHARLRIVAVGFAIAFGSIGLRLIDMVDSGPWRSAGTGVALASGRSGRAGGRKRRAGRHRRPQRRGPRDQHPGARDLRRPVAAGRPAEAARQLASDPAPGVEPPSCRPAGGRAPLRLGQAPHHARGAAGRPRAGPARRRLQHGDQRVYPKERADQPRRRLSSTSTIEAWPASSARCDDRLRHGAARAAGAQPRSAHPADRARASCATAYHRFGRRAPTAIVLDRLTGELLAHGQPARLRPEPGRPTCARPSASTVTPATPTSWARCSRSSDPGRWRWIPAGDAARQLRRHRPLQIGRFTHPRRPRQEALALGARDLHVLVQHRHGPKMAFAAGGADACSRILPTGSASRAARHRDRRGWSRRRPRSAGPTSPRPPLSFGHGIAVTPLQFVDAAGGLVGDGTPYRRRPWSALGHDATCRAPRLVSATTADRPALADVAHRRAGHAAPGQAGGAI